MKLSTKARHAITAMMDLAINDKYKPVTLSDISQCQGISLSYLEQLFAKLRKSNLVIGVRGPAAVIGWHAHPMRYRLLKSLAQLMKLYSPR